MSPRPGKPELLRARLPGPSCAEDSKGGADERRNSAGAKRAVQRLRPALRAGSGPEQSCAPVQTGNSPPRTRPRSRSGMPDNGTKLLTSNIPQETERTHTNPRGRIRASSRFLRGDGGPERASCRAGRGWGATRTSSGGSPGSKTWSSGALVPRVRPVLARVGIEATEELPARPGADR